MMEKQVLATALIRVVSMIIKTDRLVEICMNGLWYSKA